MIWIGSCFGCNLEIDSLLGHDHGSLPKPFRLCDSSGLYGLVVCNAVRHDVHYGLSMTENGACGSLVTDTLARLDMGQMCRRLSLYHRGNHFREVAESGDISRPVDRS